MTPEFWVIAAAILLGLAAASSGLTVFAVRGRWALVAVCARGAGAAALAVALGVTVIGQGQWSPFDLRLIMLSLVLAMLVAHLVLAWHLRISTAASAVDVVALALILVQALPSQQAASPMTICIHHTVPFQAQWILFMLGGGGVLAAASAGLMLLAQAKVRTGHGRNPELRPIPLRSARGARSDLLIQGTFLGLVALGTGLAVSAWWSWQTMGTTISGDPREIWMAITWLVAAMSLLAWQLEKRRGWWATGLAGVAAACLLFGLLAYANLQHLLGI